ncbi:MAG: (d)CMP kinase [Cyclobacteriaceae bacterium]
MPQDIIVAIDGYSGCGKSSTAKAVAHAMDYTYIDSGAMYRAVTFYLLRNNIKISDTEAVVAALPQIHIHFKAIPQASHPVYETYLDGENVEQEIRSMAVSEQVSAVSAVPLVRKAMVELQRNMGADKRVVMDGRDIGTNVFPQAEVKVFMTAELNERARRRQIELAEKGTKVPLDEIARNLAERDRIDTTRTENPLVKAADAVEVDTTHLTFDEQIAQIITLARQAIRS